ncbi:MAG TPA: biotin/lipoyl-containing protein, partial [Bacteroidota bacterium]|nr:biotin/lipoyl-containing protein [Bacteroidota bacterium]
MARIEIVMPQMGESIVEGTIVRWHKKVGERVRKDETLLEISTDKVDSEIPSPAEGILAEIVTPENGTVPVRTVIAYLETEGGGDAPALTSRQAEPPAPERAAGPVPARVPEPTGPPAGAGRFYSP